MFGILNLNKPEGPTSRDCVSAVERQIRPLKVGHAGTLDPIASGVLLLLVGQAVRLTDAVHTLSKEYVGKFQLGVTSDSADTESPLCILPDAPILDREHLEKILPKFMGEIEQTPPKYSAIWVDGKRAHELAREGKTFEIPKRTVSIEEIELLEYRYPHFELRVRCGTGTYIRSIGRDIAIALGSDAVMTGLVRTSIGPFTLADSCTLESLEDSQQIEKNLQPASLGVRHWHNLVPSDQVLLKLEQGKTVLENEFEDASLANYDVGKVEVAALDSQGRLRALIKKIGPQQWRADKCFLLSMQ